LSFYLPINYQLIYSLSSFLNKCKPLNGIFILILINFFVFKAFLEYYTGNILENMNKKTSKNKLTDTIKAKIRNDFVHGTGEGVDKLFPTLDDLIDKYKVAQSTLYRTARDENWKIQKEQFKSEFQKKLDNDRIKKLSTESIKIDNTTISLAKGLFTTVGIMIQENSVALQNGKKGLKANDITSLANAVSIAQRITKLALGEATHNIDAKFTENTDAFRRAMELLDTVEEQRRSQSNGVTH